MSSIHIPPGATRSVEGSRASAEVIELDLAVLVGAAVRGGLRADADLAHLTGLLAALRRHTARGDPACKLLVPWLKRRIASQEIDR